MQQDKRNHKKQGEHNFMINHGLNSELNGDDMCEAVDCQDSGIVYHENDGQDESTLLL